MTDCLTSWVQKSPVEGKEDEMRGKGGKVGRENMEAEVEGGVDGGASSKSSAGSSCAPLLAWEFYTIVFLFSTIFTLFSTPPKS